MSRRPAYTPVHDQYSASSMHLPAGAPGMPPSAPAANLPRSPYSNLGTGPPSAPPMLAMSEHDFYNPNNPSSANASYSAFHDAGYGAGYFDDSQYPPGDDKAASAEKMAPMEVNYSQPPRAVGHGYPHVLSPPPVAPYGQRPGTALTDSSPALMSQSQVAWAQRQAMPKRGLTRKVKLTKGHWIVEHRVPTAIRNAFEPQWTQGSRTTEFTHMRYTAATCDPDDFTKENGWTLRASDQYGRDTELLIAITYYNEDRILVARTLHGVMLNIRDICKSKSSKFWRRSAEEGRPGWQRIVVSLIFDGIDPCDKEVLDLLATVGVYQDGVMKRQVDGKETVAHIFEYTTQLSIDAKPSLVQPHGNDDSNLVPVQLIFCLKQQNSKKINSHRWLFNALGRHLEPETCILLDAGTKPSPKSLYYLWEAMYNDRHLGGCCGEIHAMIKGGVKLFNPLVAAQNFEYKMSNILDKPLESAFGYVSVLPGAFSAYRYKAIQGRPLQQYFHGDHTLAKRLGKKGVEGMGIFTKNMFLAEDRILCFELVFKRGDRWRLGYVKHAKGETDVPEGAAELISQRRRWLNGSFAASCYSLVHFWKVYQSGHNVIRIFFLHIQALYNFMVLFVTWFALANFWLTFSIIIKFLPDNILNKSSDTAQEIMHWVNLGCEWVYIFFLMLQFVLALGNRPKAEARLYILSFMVFAVMGLYLLVVSLWLTVNMLTNLAHEIEGSGSTFWQVIMTHAQSTTVLIASLIATFGVYLIASIMYADPWHMLTSFPQYIAIAPSMTNILNVYAFCNLHDVSWGTKGSDKVDALPSVDTKKAKAEDGTIEELEQDQEDIDAHFREVVQRAVAPLVVEVKPDKPTMDDSNRTFRTRLVIFWILCNGALTVAIQNLAGLRYNRSEKQVQQEEQQTQGYYFKVLLWTTFGLAFFKFCGFLVWWSTRLIGKPCRKS